MKKLRDIARRSVGFLCALALLITILPTVELRAETTAEKLARLRQELSDLSADIKQEEQNAANADKLMKQYQSEQALILELIEANQQSIAETQEKVDAKQAEIAKNREVIYENQELFESRLIAIYKMNNAGVLSTALAVDSYSDLLSVTSNLRVISEHDTNLLDTLQAEHEQMEKELAELDALLAEQMARQEELDELADYYMVNIQKQKLAKDEAEAKAEMNKVLYGDSYEEYLQALRDMDYISGNQGGSSSGDGSQYEGGQFLWPVNGHYNVSCEFGAPDPNGTPHNGMDISGGGIGGKPILACASGTVITATYHSSYGNYVVIDHGGGLKTLYAHASGLNVSAGSYVERGATIGWVGTTGFSTGNHLHLEVTVNNVRQNPRSYF